MEGTKPMKKKQTWNGSYPAAAAVDNDETTIKD
jgi:hypothetical protein